MAWVAAQLPYIGLDIQKVDTGMRHMGIAVERVGAAVARIDRD